MNILNNIIHYFKGDTALQSPRRTYSISWGKQEYEGKIRTLLKDKQIDINNHKESYAFIQKFMKKYIDGITLKKGIVHDCAPSEGTIH